MLAVRSGLGRIAALTGLCFEMFVGKQARVCMSDCLSLPGNFSWRSLLVVLVFLASFGPVPWSGEQRWAAPPAFAQGEGDSCPATRTVDVEEGNCRTAGVAAAVCARFCFDALHNDLMVRAILIGDQDFRNLFNWLVDVEPRFEAALVRHHDQFCAERSAVSEDVFETTDLSGLTAVDASASRNVFPSFGINATNRWWYYDVSVIIREDGKVGCRASRVHRASEDVYSPLTDSDQVVPVVSEGDGDGYHICR